MTQIKIHPRHVGSRPPGEKGMFPNVELEIVRGRAKNKLRPVNVPAFLIGTAADCDLVLGDPQFPEVFAYLLVSAEGVSLRHLGFLPELTVNGVQVTRAKLADGDRLRTGPYEFVIHISEDASRDDERPQEERPDALCVPIEVDRVEDEIGCEQVRALLLEIRASVAPRRAANQGLRLYVEEWKSREDRRIATRPYGGRKSGT